MVCSKIGIFSYCGHCEYSTNYRAYEDKIYYGDKGYDVVYCEEVTCKIDGLQHHPVEPGCEHFKEK